MYAAFLAIWIVFLIGAFAYARKARHPLTRPLAAWLVFVTVFSAAAVFLFATGIWLLAVSDSTALLDDPLFAVLFLALVFVPSFFLGRWQLRKPPRTPREP